MAAEAGVFIYFYPNKPYSYVKIFDYLDSIGWGKKNKEQYNFIALDDPDGSKWDGYSSDVEEIRNVLEKKQKKDEIAGIDLYYKSTEMGICMYLHTDFYIRFSYEINRKVLENEFCLGRKKTDMEWYQQTLVTPFKNHFPDVVKELKFIESYW